MNHDRYSDDYIAGILREVRTFAFIGASANTSRPSYFAMKYLLSKGYTIHPVNPGIAGQKLLGQVIYATLTVHFIPDPPLFTLPRLPDTGWSPLRTFARAFGLFATIFTFILDLVIWLTVVVGPFILMALGARYLARRLRVPPGPS